MTRYLVVTALILSGCAATSPVPQTLAHRHSDNVAAAVKEGYRVTSRDGQTLFCRTEPPIGSHVMPACLTEAQWEQRGPSIASILTSGAGESGRSPTSGYGGPYVGH